MVAAAAAETRQGLRTVCALVRRVTTLGAPRRLTTSGAAVSEPLAFVAPEGVGYKHPDILAKPADDEFLGK